MINVSMVTPTLEELSAFDSILVYSIDPYKDAKSLGNVVSEYALSGGGVVTASHEGNTHSLQGEWIKQKLNVYEHDDNYKEAKHSMGNVLVEGHPILAKVKSFKGNSLHARKENPLNGKIYQNGRKGLPWSPFAMEMKRSWILAFGLFPTRPMIWDIFQVGIQALTGGS